MGHPAQGSIENWSWCPVNADVRAMNNPSSFPTNTSLANEQRVMDRIVRMAGRACGHSKQGRYFLGAQSGTNFPFITCPGCRGAAERIDSTRVPDHVIVLNETVLLRTLKSFSHTTNNPRRICCWSVFGTDIYAGSSKVRPITPLSLSWASRAKVRLAPSRFRR
jgi:hypothetical protein